MTERLLPYDPGEIEPLREVAMIAPRTCLFIHGLLDRKGFAFYLWGDRNLEPAQPDPPDVRRRPQEQAIPELGDLEHLRLCQLLAELLNLRIVFNKDVVQFGSWLGGEAFPFRQVDGGLRPLPLRLVYLSSALPVSSSSSWVSVSLHEPPKAAVISVTRLPHARTCLSHLQS
jgi:hypothetical protein